MNESQPPLDEKFKDPEDPLRLVFVCAMWMTGFDAPSCSTMYLDKPMRNHTLMQTIARANRVFPGKHSGVIVDYANVFASLEKALAIYGAGKGGKNPVSDKKELVEELRKAMNAATAFCQGNGVMLNAIELLPDPSMERLKRIDDAVDAVISPDSLLSRNLSEEQQRHVRENMSEEELVIFDIVVRPAPELSPEERAKVKKVARELLAKLKELIVINWRQKSMARSQLKLSIEDVLNKGLPRVYSPELYKEKCMVVFQHFYENYSDKDASVYAAAS